MHIIKHKYQQKGTYMNESPYTIADRLKFIRGTNGLLQSVLAKKAGISQRQISLYESGRATPRAATLQKLADALGVSPEWLEFGDEETDYMINDYQGRSSTLEAHHVPIMAWDAAGDHGGLGFFRDVIPVPDIASKEAFALRVKGDSMAPDYPAGSIIVVDPSVHPQSGDDVIARTEDGITFKRYSAEPNGKAYLVPLNRQFPATEFLPDGDVIVGVVVLQLIYRNQHL